MDTNLAFATSDEYADWINKRIGDEVARLRDSVGISAYRLGAACGVSDQTILNLEQGNFERGVLSGTLGPDAWQFISGSWLSGQEVRTKFDPVFN